MSKHVVCLVWCLILCLSSSFSGVSGESVAAAGEGSLSNVPMPMFKEIKSVTGLISVEETVLNPSTLIVSKALKKNCWRSECDFFIFFYLFHMLCFSIHQDHNIQKTVDPQGRVTALFCHFQATDCHADSCCVTLILCFN